MSDQQDAHDDLFEQIACLVCDKTPGLSMEECFENKNKPFCQKDGKCRIFEKTEEQLRYVSYPLSKNVFLTACPGSGKTEVVGLKAAYETKKWEHQHVGIAFLTFTNNATSVIRERVVQVAGVGAVGYPHYIGTIDSWLHRYIAHPFAHRVTGYTGENSDCSIRIVENSSNAGFLNSFQTRYSINGKGGIKANQYFFDLAANHIVFWSGKYQLDNIRNGWQLLDWQRRQLKETKGHFLRNGFATYQDIESICYRILDIAEISRLLASRFPFMVIDECQDLSTNQLKIIEQLIRAGVFVHFVGDLEQSIYSFKGVNPRAIEDFVLDNDFSRQELAENFRSPQPIVDLCSRLVNQEGVIGRGEQNDENNPTCVFLTYPEEADMANLPEKFSNILDTRMGIDIENSAILARNYSIIGKVRYHGDPKQRSIAYFPAIAINVWNTSNRSLNQTEEAISLMGKFLAEKMFSSSSSNSRRYYCPECVSSPIQWRVFLASVLSECCSNASLVNFQQTWSQWSKNFRQYFVNIIQQTVTKFDAITLPKDIKTSLKYRSPNGQSNNAVADSLPILPNGERINIRITTFHKIKGETLDAALVVSSRTGQGRGGGYWLKWLEDPNSENARFAYVASSRPKHLLAWAIPAQSLDKKNREKLDELGFVEIIEE